MRLTLVFIFIGAATACVFAQKDTATQTIRSTEVHAGFGFQHLLHAGTRFRVNDLFMLEIALGTDYPFNKDSPHLSISGGVTLIPRPTQRHPGFIFSLLYTAWYKDDVEPYITRGYSGFIHLITGNIGFVMQHYSGFSFLARLGGGLAIYDYDFRTHSGDIGYEDYVEFWPNLELAFGYAF